MYKFLAIFLFLGLAAKTTLAEPQTSLIDQRIQDIIHFVQESNYDRAIELVSQTIEEYPKYKVAKVLLADLISIRNGVKPLTQVDIGDVKKPKKTQALAMLEEVKSRRKFNDEYAGELANKLPKDIVYVSPQYEHFVLVDVDLNRLFVYKNTLAGLELLTQYYTTIGKHGYDKYREGDQKTPTGFYFMQQKISKSILDPKRFGRADAIPINYPNVFDKAEGRTGYGIWFHGTAIDTLTRPPMSSDGCITLMDSEMNELHSILNNKTTPVLIASGVEWLDKEDWNLQSKKISEATLIGWEQAWESQDFDVFQEFYHADFANSAHASYGNYMSYKKNVIENKEFIKLSIKGEVIVRDPKRDILISYFDQNYETPSYKSLDRKRIVWKLQDKDWKVVNEDAYKKPLRKVNY